MKEKKPQTLLIVVVVLFLAHSRSICGDSTNFIHHGKDGTYAVRVLGRQKSPTTVIGTLRGYEIIEIDSPVRASRLGKLMALDSRGYVWFVESQQDLEVRVDPNTLEMTTFQLPSGIGPYSIDIDAKNRHWIAAYGTEMLVESHPDEGYCIARSPPTPGFINHVRVDSYSNTVWFTQAGVGQLVCFREKCGFVEYPLPTKQAGPGRLDVDREGNVWVPEMYTGRIARLNTQSGQWTEWDLPSENAFPAFCRVDEDGGVWIAETAADKIAYFKDGHFKEFDVPTHGSITSTNVRDSEGYLWFTEGGWRGGASGNKIGVLDPVSGNVAELPLPSKNAQPLGLLCDQEGTIWFQQCTVGKICRAKTINKSKKILK